MRGWYPALFLSAATLTLLVTPVVRAAAVRLGAIDAGGGRHVHRGRVPRDVADGHDLDHRRGA